MPNLSFQSTRDSWGSEEVGSRILFLFPTLVSHTGIAVKLRERANTIALLVTFVPHSSELFQSVQVCRTLSTGLKCKQPVSRQTVAGRIAFSRCYHELLNETTLIK